MLSNTWKVTEESKLCFVTTGATAPFTALIESALSPDFLDVLVADGYTHLLIQYGTARDVYVENVKAARAHLEQTKHIEQLRIAGIDFNPDGLKREFNQVQLSNGVVVSHAGDHTRILYTCDSA
jgi:beta-1,4-N-acetylglucosaminyltransferase